MITKTHIKSAVLTIAVIAVLARTPAKEYILGDDKLFGIF